MTFKSERSFLTFIKDSHRDNQWTDIRILNNGHTFNCHKFILGTSSNVLHNVFTKSDTGSEVDYLVFDKSFDHFEVQQLLSYVYGVETHPPQCFAFLFPSHLQVKPDLVKHEILEPLLDDENSRGNLHGSNGHYNNYSEIDLGGDGENNYDDGPFYEYDDDFIDDDEEEEDYRSPYKKKKPKAKKLTRVTAADGSKKYECPYCGKHVNKLPIHVEAAHKDMWEHFNESRRRGQGRKSQYPKQCPQCPKQLPDKWHYDKHLRTHMEPGQRKAVMTKLKQEAEEFGNFVCAKCGEEFPTKSAMKNHEYKHKNEVTCDFKDCNEIFLSYVQYCNHMLIKHRKVIKRRKCYAKIKTGPEDSDKKEDSEDSRHLCPECGKGYVSENAVKKHMEYMHPVHPINTFVCSVCGKNFKNNSKLKNHMLLHEPPTKPCPFCDKLFETNHKVKKHIKSNHVEDDQKLYQCEYCKKGFSRKESYEGHLNDHKNIRPYQCNMCDKAYRNSFDFQQHVKKAHGVTNMADIAKFSMTPQPQPLPGLVPVPQNPGFSNMVESWNKFG